MKQLYRNLLLALPVFAFAQYTNAQCLNCGTGADGAYNASSNTTLPGGTYNFTTFDIGAGATVSVTGTAPLVIYCTGAVNISGTLTVTGGNGTDGVISSNAGIAGIAVAGGHDGGDGVYSSSTGPLPGVAGSGPGGAGNQGDAWSGGGGAGYATGADSSGNSGGGFGGPMYGNAQLSSIDGGSGGGGGSGGYSCGGGGGGAGGGIIVINSCVSITINAAGAVLANGGNGGSDGTGNCGGGGGGSGGSIYLLSSNIVQNGAVSAVGGSGGASNVPGNPYYGGGAAGANGRIRFDGNAVGSGTTTPAVGFSGTVLTAIVTSSNVTCNGGSDGVATVTIMSGTGPYTYSWAPAGGTTSVASGLTMGTYTCTITDATTCSITVTCSITEPPAIAISTTVNSIMCNGACDGSITAVVSGGTGPYTYMWTPGNMTTPTAINLCAGCYTVTITDANGCINTAVSCVTQPPVLTAMASGTDCSTTSSNDGTLSGSASGGTPGYTMQWQPGNLSGASQSGVAPGTYTLTVCDANNCCDTATVVIGDGSGIASMNSGIDFGFYPNPANDKLNLSISLNQESEFILEVFDVTGKKIDAVSFGKTKQLNYAYNVSALTNGVYLFRITSNGNSVTQRVTVSH